MWHMGVDTTTNPASHTQAQSIIKAQKDGGSPRFFQPGRKKGTAAGGAERKGSLSARLTSNFSSASVSAFVIRATHFSQCISGTFSVVISVFLLFQ